MRSKISVIVTLSAVVSLMLTSVSLFAGDGLSRADLLYREGKFDSAISILLEQEVPALESQHDTLNLIKAWSILGCCYVEKGDMDQAARYCGLTSKALKYIGTDFYSISNTLLAIGQIYHQTGSYDEAIDYVDRAIVYEQELDRPTLVARRYIEKATILMDKGDYAGALEVLELGQPLVVDLVNLHYFSELTYYKCLCYESLGDTAAASKCLDDAEMTAHLSQHTTDYALSSGLTLKYAEYALAEQDTAKAVAMYRVSARNARNTHDNPIGIAALRALSEIFRDSDPAASAMYAARADSLDFAPLVSELTHKMAIAGIEFPRREREQQLQIQRMRVTLLSLVALLLAVASLFLWSKFRSSKRMAEVERDKSAMLERELDHKQRLLALAESAPDYDLSQKVKQMADELGDMSALTRREREICAMITEGLFNKEIAARLEISPRTVETHRNSIYRKLKVSNTAELIKVLDEINK